MSWTRPTPGSAGVAEEPLSGSTPGIFGGGGMTSSPRSGNSSWMGPTDSDRRVPSGPTTGPSKAWSARDAIVLKAVAIVLGRGLDGPVVDGCTSWAGAGGAKRAVREVEAARPDHSFVFRSDVRNYYASLGYRFGLGGVRVEGKTVERCVEGVNRLDEQGADEVRIGEYVRRWSGWVRGGLGFDVRGAGSVCGCWIGLLAYLSGKERVGTCLANQRQ